MDQLNFRREAMRKTGYLIFIAAAAFTAIGGCRSHIDLQSTPEQYAKLRGIELLTTEPTRPFEVVATVRGTGGRHTAKETMVNAMIDAAQRAGARALIPLESSKATERVGASGKNLDVFVYIEDGKRVTKGRAIQWVGNN